MNTDELETIEGEVKAFRAFPSGTGGVLDVATGKALKVKLIGDMPEFAVGSMIRSRVKKTVHARFGVQYKVYEIEETGFKNTTALVNYLSGPAFPGIGTAAARLVVNHFGMDALTILDGDPERVTEVAALPANKQQIIVEQWTANRAVHRQMSKLVSLGMTVTLAMKVGKQFGEDAMNVVARTPYRLTEVSGIGFKRADEIALRQGIARDSMERAVAAASYVMEQGLMQGHCYLHLSSVADAACKEVGGDFGAAKIGEAVKVLVSRGLLVSDRHNLYLSHIHACEREVASALRDMLSKKREPLYTSIEALRERLAALGVTIQLAPEQEAALMNALNSPLAIITGGPGVGKSTILDALCRLFDHHKIEFGLCSPTGRAAKRMTEATKRPARTIHRMLEVSPEGGFKYNEQSPLPFDAVVMDEASMVDIQLMRHLLMALESNDRLVLVGDANQLPSVGPGNVLRDMIASGAIPTVKLERIFRQDAGSNITVAAHQVLHGTVPKLPTPRQRKGSNCMFVSAGDPEALLSHIVHLVSQALPNANVPASDVQVLTPMNGGGLGVQDINPALQAALNPEAQGKDEIKTLNRILRVGDKVMQTSNDYKKGVFNGDMGLIEDITRNRDVPLVHVRYPDMDKPVTYETHEIDALTHAWAVTVHKCLPGSQRVSVYGRGLIPLQDVAVGDRVWTGQGEYKAVKGVFGSGKKEVFRLETKSGYILEASEEHPVLTRVRDGYEFVRVGDLKASDVICLTRESCAGQELIPLPPAPNVGRTAWAPPPHLNDNIAWLLGVIVGDGCYTDMGDGRVDVTNQDASILQDTYDGLSALGLSPSVYSSESKSASVVCVVSKSFREWLSQIGFGYTKSPLKSVPGVIFAAPAGVRAAFLKGLFDTDGCAGSGKARLVTSSRQLSEEAQTLLMSVGVASVRRWRSGTSSWCVSVSGPSLAVFAEKVGFTVGYKSRLLSETVSAQNCGKTNIDTVPSAKSLLCQWENQFRAATGKGFQSKSNLSLRAIVSAAYRKDDGCNLSYWQIGVIARHFEGSGVDIPIDLARLLRDHYYFDAVAGVQSKGEVERMFDIEVDGLHSFSAGGFVCHNSQGSEYPAVIMVMHPSQWVMLQRNLIYTGMTRAKKWLVIAGTEDAVERAVGNNEERTRNTTLKILLEAKH
jgi:exodeoxyribonuclease V alpha subunit